MFTARAQLVRKLLLRHSTAQCLAELLPTTALAAQPSRYVPSQLTACAVLTRQASGSSSRWLARQTRDPFTRASKVSALKSRAAFKLLEIDQKHRLFRPGQTVVDLGYAPGSWSQVAISRVKPAGSKNNTGRVVGIDVIPAQPPRGVSTIQGDFLSSETRQRVVEFVRDPQAGHARGALSFASRDEKDEDMEGEDLDYDGICDMTDDISSYGDRTGSKDTRKPSKAQIAAQDEAAGRVVDIVLSDMNEPWPLVNAWVNSVVNPYRRMMNTTGNSFKDHVGSMDLCLAALSFSYDTLKTGGSLLCKYFQGSDDKQFEMRLKALFEKVYRIKPDSSRKESREAYFLAMHRLPDVPKETVFRPL